MLYFDNAATTIHKPDCVAESVFQAFNTIGNASRGAHSISLGTARIIEDTREKIAELFHAPNPERVVFTMNATESLNIVIQGLFNKGDHVITTACEHNSVLRPLYYEQTQGVELSIVPANKKGIYQIKDFEDQIQKNTKAIICTHASNVTGNVYPIDQIGELCRNHHILFVLDASQTAGSIPIDMQANNISILCFTGHKGLLGPQGTGGICLSDNVTIKPLLVGGSGIHSFDKEHPRVFPTALEAGTLNAHGLVGLNASLNYLLNYTIQEIHKQESILWKTFYNGIKDIPNIIIYGDYSSEMRAPIVAINIKGYEAAMVSDELSERFQIATRPGAHCAPLMHESLGTVEQGIVRFSFSHFNTLSEIQEGIHALRILATE